MNALTGLIIRHEIRILKRNPMMWFRFFLFYAVFVAALVTDILRDRGERVTITAVGLMILAAVGVSSALATESFVQDKERRTMEALLLIPTSARELASAKSVFVIILALVSVGVAFLTGPIVLILTGQPHQAAGFFIRPTLTTAFVICPPAAMLVAALGIVVSSRSRGFHTTTAAAPLGGMMAILPTVILAYWVSHSPVPQAIGVSVVWWVGAITTWRWALSKIHPGLLIRARGA